MKRPFAVQFRIGNNYYWHHLASYEYLDKAVENVNVRHDKHPSIQYRIMDKTINKVLLEKK